MLRIKNNLKALTIRKKSSNFSIRNRNLRKILYRFIDNNRTNFLHALIIEKNIFDPNVQVF